MSIEIIRKGRRSYFSNLPFALKDAVKSEGARWDSDERMWWMGNDDKARALAGRLNSAPAPTPEATGRYTKLDDGSWGVRGKGLVVGRPVTVFKRSGERKTETIKAILSTTGDGYQIAKIEQSSRSSNRSRSNRYTYNGSGWSCGGICPVGGFRCTPSRPCHDCQ